jgi:hypothetical protein
MPRFVDLYRVTEVGKPVAKLVPSAPLSSAMSPR